MPIVFAEYVTGWQSSHSSNFAINCSGRIDEETYMSLEPERRQKAYDNIVKALQQLQSLRTAWTTMADTAPIAIKLESVEESLTGIRKLLAVPSADHMGRPIEPLPRAITTMRVIKRAELEPIINLAQSAYDDVFAPAR
jgi:hypothetical protein